MCRENDSLNERLAHELLDCQEEKKDLRADLEIWTDALEELSDIEDASKLVEAGFEYICDYDGIKLFRKRK